MIVKQLSVFLENRAGRLAEVIGILAEGGINIRALTVAETADFGVVRMIVQDVDKAHSLLKGHAITSAETSVIAAEVPDEPGGLSALLKLIAGAGVNIEYMYAMLERRAQKAVMIFRLDDSEGALKKLTNAGVRVLAPEEVYQV
jgi:hypothetical protein